MRSPSGRAKGPASAWRPGEKSANMAWGISGERGSLMAAIDYAESGEVNMADRLMQRFAVEYGGLRVLDLAGLRVYPQQ